VSMHSMSCARGADDLIVVDLRAVSLDHVFGT
jgi:hypothetical protein